MICLCFSSYDLCEILTPYRFNDTETHCPLMVVETSPDFPCACPFKAGTYHLNPTTFQIPELGSLVEGISQVTFRLHVVNLFSFEYVGTMNGYEIRTPMNMETCEICQHVTTANVRNMSASYNC